MKFIENKKICIILRYFIVQKNIYFIINIINYYYNNIILK